MLIIFNLDNFKSPYTFYLDFIRTIYSMFVQYIVGPLIVALNGTTGTANKLAILANI